ncbi:MAG: hypothetical protein R3F65_03185 [bacterium]
MNTAASSAGRVEVGVGEHHRGGGGCQRRVVGVGVRGLAVAEGGFGPLGVVGEEAGEEGVGFGEAVGVAVVGGRAAGAFDGAPEVDFGEEAADAVAEVGEGADVVEVVEVVGEVFDCVVCGGGFVAVEGVAEAVGGAAEDGAAVGGEGAGPAVGVVEVVEGVHGDFELGVVRVRGRCMARDSWVMGVQWGTVADAAGVVGDCSTGDTGRGRRGSGGSGSCAREGSGARARRGQVRH